MENLYLLLITNRASNIIEDLETLRLLSKVVPDIAGSTNNLTEEKISEKCFDLIFAFDEVITTGGYREPITLPQIRTNLEMDSHEEKLHKMIKQSKMEQARDQAKEAAKSIKEKQKDSQRTGFGSSGMVGIGSGSNDNLSSAPLTSMEALSLSSNAASSLAPAGGDKPPGGVARKVVGISLSGAKAGKGHSLEDALIKEDKLAPLQTLKTKQGASSGASGASEAAVVAPAVQHPVMLQVLEKVSAKLSRDGNVSLFEIKGSLTLTASTDESALCSVQLALGETSDFVFTTHPKVNRPLYDKSGLLQLKDITKGFPSARPVGVLKWTHSAGGGGAADSQYLPLKVNCWPDEEARGVMNVSIEYSKEIQKLTLSGVTIKIPLGTSASPQILTVDGTHRHNASAQELLWELAMIDDSNATGTLEFSIQQKSADAFFPIDVQFSSSELFCGLEVTSVRTADGRAPIMYGISKSMSTEEYTIE